MNDNDLNASEREKVFEKNAKAICQCLWPQSVSIPDGDGGRERDGLYFGPDTAIAMEATVAANKRKAFQDLGKLASRIKVLRSEYPERLIQAIWIVRDEPNLGQIEAYNEILREWRLEKRDLRILTLRQLEQKLVDAARYIQARDKAPFGSVADPENGSFDDRTEYIPLDMINAADGTPWSVPMVIDALHAGRRFTILGDYGAGKSMTLREVFRKMRVPALKGDSSRFPVFLNLREHHGQTRAAEALQRHAVELGIEPQQLVGAWRAGFVTVLLDGFDELGTAKAVGSPKKVRDARRETVTLVRDFFDKTPAEAGVLVSGRSFYFDTPEEREAALGAGTRSTTLTLNEFTSDQVARFLSKHKIHGEIPSWLPSRPLLLGYLASRGILKKVMEEDGEAPPSHAWDMLLTAICEREAKQQSALDGNQLRELIERLASRTRQMAEGGGPVTTELIWEVFEELHNRQPDERDVVQINRLPGLAIVPSGLGGRSPSSGGRFFIDEDFLDAARAGDVSRLITFGPSYLDDAHLGQTTWCQELDQLGIAIVVDQVRNAQVKDGLIQTAFDALTKRERAPYLLYDLLRVLVELSLPIQSHATIAGAEFGEFELEQSTPGLSTLTFQTCYFERVSAIDVDPARCPVFASCLIEVLEEDMSESSSGSVFVQCDVGRHVKTGTTVDEILDKKLPQQVRVLLTMLKKLYRQRGRGRMQSALSRGLRTNDRRFVVPLLQVLKNDGLARPITVGGETIWLPERSMRGRVESILNSPTTSVDPILAKVRTVG